MKGGGGWDGRGCDKRPSEKLSAFERGSWEIYRNNNNERVGKSEGEAATLNSWSNLRSPRLLSLPLNPQYNSRISRNSWVSRPRLYFERKRSITTFLDTKDWYRPIKRREKQIFANKIILYTKRIKRVKISIANRKASYARVIMIYVVDIGFSLRGIRSSIMFAKNRWPLSRWPERLSNTLFHFRSRSYLPLKSKDRLRLICGSRPRDLGLRLFYKKAGKSSWSMRGTRVLTLNFSPLPR